MENKVSNDPEGYFFLLHLQVNQSLVCLENTGVSQEYSLRIMHYVSRCSDSFCMQFSSKFRMIMLILPSFGGPMNVSYGSELIIDVLSLH